MSLISEALKKARLESARKEDRRHGLLAPSHGRERRSVLPWILTAGSLSLAIGVIVGVVLRSGGEDPTPRSVVVPAQQIAPILEPQTRQAVPPRQQSTPSPVVALEPEVQPDSMMPEIEPAPAEPLPDSTQEKDLPADSPSSVLQERPDAIRVEPPPSTGPRDGDSFLRTVPLPGDKVLVLNGIAWSESGPVALINGRALEKGEYVDGWMLGLIERQQVELLKDEVAIRVRLK